MSSSFLDLRVWQEAMKLASHTYPASAPFPKHELHDLSQQMRRVAVSVPSNIAEGTGHYSNKAFSNFLLHAGCSRLELQTQIEIAGNLQYLARPDAERLLHDATVVGRNLSGLNNSLESRSAKDQRPTTKRQDPNV